MYKQRNKHIKMKLNTSGVFVVCLGLLLTTASASPNFPDTSGISGQLTSNLEVDKFFSLFIVFNKDEIQISDQPYTILAPKNPKTEDKSVLNKPELVKKIVLDHLVLGQKINTSNTTLPISFETISGKTVIIKTGANGKLYANDVEIISNNEIPNGNIIILDKYLFSDHNITSENKKEVGMLTTINAPKEEKEIVQTKEQNKPNVTFCENVGQVLSFLKSGARVFQHFLGRSNVSNLIKEGQQYTVFVPTDIAFQRWHPIDWGFYPFSVPEFTESVMINHFVIGNLRQGDIKDGQIAKTLGGREISFSRTPILTVNGASMVIGDTPIPNGNMMFISEVLFVSESVVSRLHQQHRDKETPPLLAFPWFGAQFLSHSFLALERDKRFTHITRFLNLADLAPHVSGAGYTFFVPTDEAFEKVGLHLQPDNFLSTADGLSMLLNHFVKGRLYDRDLKEGTQLITLGNRTINIQRASGNITVNNASIVETEVFVYNLGTMFYIDNILFLTKEILSFQQSANQTNVNNSTILTSTVDELATTTISNQQKRNDVEQFTTPDVEKVPSEIAEVGGTSPDVLLDKTDELNYTTVLPTVNSKFVGNISV